MNDDGIDADRLQQHDVFGEIARQFRIAHRMAAVFHDEGLTGIALQIGQSLGQRFGLGEQGSGGGGVGHAAAFSGPKAVLIVLPPDRGAAGHNGRRR